MYHRVTGSTDVINTSPDVYCCRVPDHIPLSRVADSNVANHTSVLFVVTRRGLSSYRIGCRKNRSWHGIQPRDAMNISWPFRIHKVRYKHVPCYLKSEPHGNGFFASSVILPLVTIDSRLDGDIEIGLNWKHYLCHPGNIPNQYLIRGQNIAVLLSVSKAHGICHLIFFNSF